MGPRGFLQGSAPIASLASSCLRVHGQPQEAASAWGGREERLQALGSGLGPGSRPPPHPHWLFLCRSWGGQWGWIVPEAGPASVEPGSHGVPGAPELSCPPLPTAPDEAPTIVSVTPHTTTSVLIRWQVRPAGGEGPVSRADSVTVCAQTSNSPALAGPEHGTHMHRHAHSHVHGHTLHSFPHNQILPRTLVWMRTQTRGGDEKVPGHPATSWP